MKKFKLIITNLRSIIFIILFFQSTTFAIRIIGNGGGDAELKMYYYFSKLNTIYNFCFENQYICHPNSNNQMISLKDHQDFISAFHSIQNIEFLDNQNGLTNINTEQNRFNTLQIPRFLLYKNMKTAVSDEQIFHLLNRSIHELINQKTYYSLNFIDISILDESFKIMIIEGHKFLIFENKWTHDYNLFQKMNDYSIRTTNKIFNLDYCMYVGLLQILCHDTQQNSILLDASKVEPNKSNIILRPYNLD